MVSSIVSINDKRYEKPIQYYLDSRLKENLDNKVIKQLQLKDKDCVLAIDGMEGSGKSTLAFQIGKYVDPTLNISRVTFHPEDFRQAIYKAKKGQCVIYDEAFTGLSSRSSISGINKALVGLMMQMRQKNLFVIVVLPTFFLLDKYVALFRTRALIHVYESKGRRGYFRLYNRKLKKRLFLLGKTTYSYGSKKSGKYVFTRFKGRFYGVFPLGDKEEEKKYIKKKEKALEESEKTPMTSGQIKYRDQRDVFIYLLRKYTKMTYRELANLIGDYNIDMTFVHIRNICAKFGDKEAKKEQEEDKKES
ncbi:MAG: hypothetical protein ACOC56_00420 [Atribacterota bacterium]